MTDKIVAKEKLENLYKTRFPIYKKSCDFRIESDENIFHLIEKIQKDFVFKNNLAAIQKSAACGTISAPPSKSMAHRSLICAALAKIGISPEEIDAILVTHEHSDHVRGLRVFASKHKIPVYATEEEIEKIL